MGWIGNRWFPRWPGDYCSGWYHPPEDGSPEVWELRPRDYEGTRDISPVWVMVNGREMPDELIARKRGGGDCEIEPYGKVVPHRFAFATHFCRTHVVFLRDEDDVLLHFKGNKSLFGQLVKEGIVQPLETKDPEVGGEPEIEVSETLATELRAFLEPMVVANEKFAGLWKQGKIGPLIGVAMKAAAGKYEGKYIKKMLREIVGEPAAV